ncbi:MAG TPA: hypothetical protein VIV57_01600 [Anaeromyxobacter sp.]
MARYTGGNKVSGGYYWNPSRWEVEVVPSEGGRLQGPPEARYVKLPFPLLFVVVPLLGALFLIFLPLIGFALFAYAIVKKVTGFAKRSATELAATVAPGGFATGEAHFTGKPGEEKPAEETAGEGEAKAQAEIERLAKEIEARKGK